MALYNFQCSKCSEIFELSKKISERDSVEDDSCPGCLEIGTLQRMVGAPLVGYSTTVSGSYGSKIPDGFKDLLKRINTEAGAKNIPNSSFL